MDHLTHFEGQRRPDGSDALHTHTVQGPSCWYPPTRYTSIQPPVFIEELPSSRHSGDDTGLCEIMDGLEMRSVVHGQPDAEMPEPAHAPDADPAHVSHAHKSYTYDEAAPHTAYMEWPTTSAAPAAHESIFVGASRDEEGAGISLIPSDAESTIRATDASMRSEMEAGAWAEEELGL